MANHLLHQKSPHCLLGGSLNGDSQVPRQILTWASDVIVCIDTSDTTCQQKLRTVKNIGRFLYEILARNSISCCTSTMGSCNLLEISI